MLAAYVSAFGLAGWQLFERYSLHQGSALDAQFAMQVQQSAEATQRMAQANSMNAQQARAMLDFFLSPDGRVTYTFFYTAVLAFGIVLLAGLGGMLGARLTPPLRTAIKRVHAGCSASAPPRIIGSGNPAGTHTYDRNHTATARKRPHHVGLGDRSHARPAGP